MNMACFAAGCFWGMEAHFRKINGVVKSRVGFAGGISSNPNYKLVRSRQTSHAEAIEIEFEPDVISYRQLLEAFWENA